MSISTIDIEVPSAKGVKITLESLFVEMNDGRTISVPLAWYPRLQYATQKERKNWRFIGKGHGIHWDNIDEDISIEGLIAGRPSGESLSSFEKFLKKRPNKTLQRTRTSSRR